MSTGVFDFLTPPYSQTDLVSFADERVNLKREDAEKYRTQVGNLREHLERYINEHPEIGLEKLLLSGSLAKGMALSTINDIDVAIYVKGEGTPGKLPKLLEWLVERLRATFPTIARENIYIDGPCIVVSFTGTGLNVEIAPILSLGDKNSKGYLWDRSTGKKILTSIPMHLDFIRKRKTAHPTHFAQTVRLLKWWATQRKVDTDNFSMRSFLIELIVAKLADEGCEFDNYHAGLEKFFVFVQNTGLKKRIAFTDFYTTSSLPKENLSVVEVFDPVNPQNNVAADMTDGGRKLLVDLADKALDALEYARNCQTKGDAIECWQELMGSSFNP